MKLKNRSGKTGVVLHRKTGKWQSQIGIGGKNKYLGLFSTVELAHEAYKKAKLKYHDSMAIRNTE